MLFDRARRSAPDSRVSEAMSSADRLQLLRAALDLLTFLALVDRPIHAAQRTIVATTRVRTVARNWPALLREDRQPPVSDFRQSDFYVARREQVRQTMRLETCAAISPAANVRVPTNASRNSRRTRA